MSTAGTLCLTFDNMGRARGHEVGLHGWMHERFGVDDERFAVVRKVLTHARKRGDIEITTAGALAERVLAQQH